MDPLPFGVWQIEPGLFGVCGVPKGTPRAYIVNLGLASGIQLSNQPKTCTVDQGELAHIVQNPKGMVVVSTDMMI